MIEEMKSEAKNQWIYIEKAKSIIRKREQESGHKSTYCVTTFGCQMNARDSEKLAGILEEIGYIPVLEEDADFVIFNTCTIRDNANSRVYGRLGVLKTKKAKNPNMKIAICGCMMQEPAVVKKIKESYSFVDMIFGTHNIFKFAEYIVQILETNKKVNEIWDATEEIVEELPIERKYAYKSGINIMFGCNNFCSYCIVPYVRGRERSRSAKDIVMEIERLVADGVTEIMLLGQNVNSYGKNLEKPISFSQLLEEVEKINGLKRIRFMTSHPKDLSDELIEVMRKSTKICKHLHLPIQSGSTKVLDQMNRKYTKEQYLTLARKIKEAIPDISLTTDIIIGFPGETKEDVDETIDVCKTVEFDNVFTYIYSRRTGTPAATMENQISKADIKYNFDRLLATVHQESAKNSKRYLGETLEVLVEEVNSHDEKYVTGRLSNNILVHFEGEKSLIGTYVQVKLVESKGFYFFGERV